jgi:hypothetical protein
MWPNLDASALAELAHHQVQLQCHPTQTLAAMDPIQGRE